MLGAALIALIWPSEGQAGTDWDEVYKNMQVILKNGLAEHDVVVAAQKVKGFVEFLNTEYDQLKADDKKTPEQLLHELEPPDTAFYLEITSVFMYGDKPDHAAASASLRNFMLGADLHIGLNQERALLDPDHIEHRIRSNPLEDPELKSRKFPS